MTTITHAMIGGAIGLLFYTFSKENPRKFKTEHVILFALNCFIGPDWSKFLSPFYGQDYWTSSLYINLNGFSHSIIGWLIIAIAFSILYYFIFRYLGEGKRTGKSPISFLHIYLLIIAGGFNHFGIDMLDSYVRVFPYQWNENYYLTVSTFFTGEKFAEGPLWDRLSWFDEKYFLVIGVIMVFVLIWIMKNKSLQLVWIVALIFGACIYLLIWLIGSNNVANENDLGILAYVLFAWIGPLMICFVSFDEDITISKNKSKNKKEEQE